MTEAWVPLVAKEWSCGCRSQWQGMGQQQWQGLELGLQLFPGQTPAIPPPACFSCVTLFPNIHAPCPFKHRMLFPALCSPLLFTAVPRPWRSLSGRSPSPWQMLCEMFLLILTLDRRAWTSWSTTDSREMWGWFRSDAWRLGELARKWMRLGSGTRHSMKVAFGTWWAALLHETKTC